MLKAFCTMCSRKLVEDIREKETEEYYSPGKEHPLLQNISLGCLGIPPHVNDYSVHLGQSSLVSVIDYCPRHLSTSSSCVCTP
ncbi:hypothetical protein AN958_03043 [Leucoagaricus sp. SymC.cos]|nr:hypothetical protein AN958_03043 [Leucoagaricus sp. SymC.cos]